MRMTAASVSSGARVLDVRVDSAKSVQVGKAFEGIFWRRRPAAAAPGAVTATASGAASVASRAAARHAETGGGGLFFVRKAGRCRQFALVSF